MSKIVLMQGLPGSLKSTLARELRQQRREASGYLEDPPIFSNDDFFMRQGRYEWDSDLFEYAQRWCVSRAAKALFDGTPYVIVDNTHLTEGAVRPYITLSKKFNCKLEIVESTAPWRYCPEECFKRNLHKVPLASIQDMLKKLLETKNSGVLNEYYSSVDLGPL